MVHFDVNDKEDRHQKLRAGKADLVVIRKEHLSREMQAKRLCPEEYVLVCTPDWKGRKLKEIVRNEHIIDFDVSDDITHQYLKRYDLFEHAVSSRYFVNRTENIAYLVQQGLGYTTLTKEFAKEYVNRGELIVLNQAKPFELVHYLAWFDRTKLPVYLSDLLDTIH